MHARSCRIFLAVLAAILLVPAGWAQQFEQVVKMSTTTSTENSGLLGYLLPLFEAETGLKVQVIAVGTGKALELAKNGDVDLTLVHARAAEDKFVAEGYGVDRRDVMHNDFIIVGPKNDPAGVRKAGKDVLKGLQKIVDSNSRFISRGDNSGTDQKEQELWKQLGAKPSGSAYVAAGLGMGEVLNMAAQMQAYTLTDRATYLAYRAKTGLAILLEGDARMLNPYGIIAVNPERHKHARYKAAMRLIDWMTSPQGQQKIALFTIDDQQVFFPANEGSR
ncbi:MAG TPA: tungsten ABC transporter substrate-binding protein [Oxalobacteraceae bacterium]|nr:tungsten ABC transporter substrate-binding protein [Oxalobacteraceae bacterium]